MEALYDEKYQAMQRLAHFNGLNQDLQGVDFSLALHVLHAVIREPKSVVPQGEKFFIPFSACFFTS